MLLAALGDSWAPADVAPLPSCSRAAKASSPRASARCPPTWSAPSSASACWRRCCARRRSSATARSASRTCSNGPASPAPPSTSTSRTRRTASSPPSTPPPPVCASGSSEPPPPRTAETWRDRLRLGLEELLRFVGEEPDAAMSLIVDARAACPAALGRRDELLDHFAGCIDSQVREEASSDPAPSPIAAAGIVGGIETLLYTRLNRGETDDLDSLLALADVLRRAALRGPRSGERRAPGHRRLSPLHRWVDEGKPSGLEVPSIECHDGQIVRECRGRDQAVLDRHRPATPPEGSQQLSPPQAD